MLQMGIGLTIPCKEDDGTKPYVAICMLGALRSFHISATLPFWAPLWQSYNVDVFAILSASDDRLQAFQAFDGICPITTEFHNTTVPQLSVPEIKGKYIWRMNQFSRFHTCRQRVLEEEARTGKNYTWIIRTRPDLHWRKELPPLHSFRSDAVSGRLRLVNFENKFPHWALADALRDNREREQGHGERNDTCIEIDRNLDRHLCLDDQFAIVPRALLDGYFGVRYPVRQQEVPPATRVFCPVDRNKMRENSMDRNATGKFKYDASNCDTPLGSILQPATSGSSVPMAELCLCAALMEAAVPISPVALHYVLARTLLLDPPFRPPPQPSPPPPPRLTPPPPPPKTELRIGGVQLLRWGRVRV